MFKLSAKLVHATNDGVRMAQRAVRTYTRYAYYSLTDRKGRQTSDGSSGTGMGTYEPKYSLVYNCAEDFVLSQWSDNPVPYAVYRTIVALYFVFMVLYTALMGTLGWKMFIMLTYWSYWLLTVSLILKAVNVWYYIDLKKQGKDIKEYLGDSPRLKTQWVLHNLSTGAAPIVTILFWTIAYDGSGYTFINCNTHGFNAMFALIDMFVTRMPIRHLHLYHGILYGITYGSFSYFYWLAGGTNQFGEPYIYKPLNYGKAPGVALSYIITIGFVVAPMFHSMMFFTYRFRVFIHRFLKAMDKRNTIGKE